MAPKVKSMAFGAGFIDSLAMGRTQGRRDLTRDDKMQLIGFLTGRLTPNGKLPFGSYKAASTVFGCHRNTVKKVWEGRMATGEPRSRGGSARQYDANELKATIAALPAIQRMTVRSTAAAANIPVSTLQAYIGPYCPLRRISVHVKPALTEAHKDERVRFAISFVERPIGLRKRYFQPMYDTVHVDEKWFYIHKVSSSYIVTEDEEPPHLTCANKRFITKVMFLAAVARPRYDYEKKRGFTGKIGIFPIIENRTAKRTTKNQTAGDIIPVPLAVDRKVYYDCLVDKVLPAIQAAWPARQGRTIYLQQDNASPHVSAAAAIRDSGLNEKGWSLETRRQPPRSPDLNILDLGFFNAIQSLQHQTHAYSVQSLIKAVEDAFASMKVQTLEKCFLTLQAVMEQVMLCGGDNTYHLPRVKRSHFPNGVFPSSLVCSDKAYESAQATISQDK